MCLLHSHCHRRCEDCIYLVEFVRWSFEVAIRGGDTLAKTFLPPAESLTAVAHIAVTLFVTRIVTAFDADRLCLSPLIVAELYFDCRRQEYSHSHSILVFLISTIWSKVLLTSNMIY